MSVPSVFDYATSTTDFGSVVADRRKNMQALNTALGRRSAGAQSAFAAMQIGARAERASSTPGSFASGLQAVGQRCSRRSQARRKRSRRCSRKRSHPCRWRRVERAGSGQPPRCRRR